MGTAGPPTFGELLRRYRRAAGLTQEELAERAGLSVSALSGLERGGPHRPRTDTVRLLAEALRLSDAERALLLAGTGRSGPPASPAPPAASPTNLPAPPAPLLGREREVATVCGLLRRPDVRLVTLTGTGGVGKTHLSLQAAEHLREHVADGVFFVGLAPLRDPALVLATIAQALGVQEAGSQPLPERLGGALQSRQVLVVLDNFEHLLAAAAEVSALLARCRGLKVLVTSRAALRVRGEYEVVVPPLAPAAAAALFVQRAQAVRADFALTEVTAPAIGALCARLEGLPLAIELAAARIRVLPPGALLRRLDSRLTLVTGGARDLPARQQTLRATLDWSHNLLAPAEQQLFAQLGVFARGGTLEALAAVCDAGSDQPDAVLDGVEALLTQSLLRRDNGDVARGEPRFVMLETIREYATERLAARGEAERTHHQHALFFLGVAERAAAGLHGPEQAVWLARLEADHDNLRAALEWARAQGRAELGLRLAGALYLFWHMRGYAAEGRVWLDGLLALAQVGPGDPPPAPVRARAVHAAGALAHYLGDYEQALRWYEEAQALRRSLGDTAGLAAVLNNVGLVLSDQGAYERASTLFEESLALARALGDPEAVSITLNNLGEVARARGDGARAAVAYGESLALAEARGDVAVVAESLRNLGDLAREQGDPGQAQTHYKDSLARLHGVNEGRLIALNLEGLAGVSAAQGDAERAARLVGMAAALRAALGAAVAPADRAAYEQALAHLRMALGHDAFAAAWAEGQAQPLERAIAYALDEPSPAQHAQGEED